jgi:lysophospholipase L1-like esterase
MTRRPRRSSALIVSIALACVVAEAAAYAVIRKPSNANVRGTVLFVGDSNLTLGAGAVVFAAQYLDHWDNGYVATFATRPVAGLRTPDCPSTAPRCGTTNYWSTRLPQVLGRTRPNAVVVNLGVNDTYTVGTETSPGYAKYGTKIDGFMRLLPKGIPIVWTNLPCNIEPSSIRKGCTVVNGALARAPSRWPRLTIAKWGGAANAHPEWIIPDNVHYTPDGYNGWAWFVVGQLDKKLEAVP